jgi:hypothetical protein
MRLPVDDEIYNVNAVWLGPPGKTPPFRARYVAYGVGAAVFVLLQIVERRIGVGFGFFALAYTLLVTVGVTKVILRVVDHDRPLGAVLRGLVNEVNAPRVQTRGTTSTLRPARVAPSPAPGPDSLAGTPRRRCGCGPRGRAMSGRGLSLRRITGHCTVAGDRVTAWYILAPLGWSFRPDNARERLIVIDTADALAQLTKRNLHLRVATRPYPVSRWAQAHDANAPAPLPGWPEHLIRNQVELASRSMADKEVYLGVDLGTSRRGLHALSGFARRAADREVAAMVKPIREVDELLRHPGFEGTPALPRQLEWLLHRSCSLGLPAPLTLGATEDGEWERDDLDEFTDHVTWTAVPYGRTILVRGEADGAEIQRHVCVLSVGRMTDLDIPPGVPWIQRTDQLPFPVEWSARVTIEDAGRVGMAMRRNIQRIRSQKDHNEHDHAEPAPGALDRHASKALTVEDELSSGFSGLSTRTAGWYRIAVSGTSEEEALDRAAAVRQRFAPPVTISRPADQYAVAREFIPERSSE